ncbi:XcyI family restriction endonuclease [Desulfosarcina sp. OttesenSCG-928-B08]|nr:XcyI family restriction endonuclease [Desulfosarcina sp. OttesenSCG-928-B08]
MNRKLIFPEPKLQTGFAFDLQRFRATYLQDALCETVGSMNISEIDGQLAVYVSREDLALMAKYGLRGELLFAVPVVLEQNPYLLGYYRLLMGYSQKEFYGNDKGFGVGPFKSMETDGKINKAVAGDIPALCTAFCRAASSLLYGIDPLKPDKELLDDLALLTVGPQLRGGANNRRGSEGIAQVFEVIHNIVVHAATDVREKTIVIASATGRKVLVQFAPDPDIIIREEMSPGKFRNIVAIEIKSGTDVSNIHNRIGEAEKSHQKARQREFTECWTVVNVPRLDMEKAKGESPSTDRFYALEALVSGVGEEYEDFRRRIISLTAITCAEC